MKIITDILIVLSGLLGGVLGAFIYWRFMSKPEGVITFFLQKYDDDVDVVQCSIKPDAEWETLMNHRRIIFSIARTPELEEAIKNNLIKKES